ncbi:MAG: S41 family peptidase [Cyanobacteria bacterium P01_A01_bin.135]
MTHCFFDCARIVTAGNAVAVVAGLVLLTPAAAIPTIAAEAASLAQGSSQAAGSEETDRELSPQTEPNRSLLDSPKAILDEAWQIIYRDYVDPDFNQTDWLVVRERLLERDYSSIESAYNALKRSLKQLDDPYTRFMTPQQYAELTDQTAGEFSGIGLRLQVHPVTGQLTVLSLLDGSPARTAGVQAGDRILMIAGQSTEGMSVQDAAELIRGEAGTDVVLGVARGFEGRSLDISVTREVLEVPAVSAALRPEANAEVGYIHLSEFSAHAAEQMQAAVESLLDQGADAFVLDLRGNPGGLLHASVEISRMWLDQGVIVQTVDRDGRSQDTYANRTALTDLPLAVLVDERSASSSEILTGALQDNGRAMVLGTQTFGKALVQAVHELNDGSGLAVTIAHYYTPKGTDISDRGITPTVELSLSSAERRQLSSHPDQRGTLADPYYREALTALQPAILANHQRTELSRTLVDGSADYRGADQ